jgi:peptidoglycan/xylan/chitin deacetylase (PgdA/CDA1 family)
MSSTIDVCTVSARIGRRLLSPLMRDRATIFMLHRLEDAATGVGGHSLTQLRDAITALRASGATIVSLRSMVERWSHGQTVDPNWVAFTIDDGFADQAIIAREVFLPLQCPVTVFLITGFLDGQLWPWDDQLSNAFRHSEANSLTLDMASKRVTLKLQSEQDKLDALNRVRQWCKEIPGTELYAEVHKIVRALQTDVQLAPPPEFRPMSWDEVRSLEKAGIDFGPHSVTHRIFSRLNQEDARLEIHNSWARLKAELSRPVPILAWPTGRSADFERKDMELARAEGLQACVATNDDYAHVIKANASQALFKINRFSLPTKRSTVIRYGSWLERARQLLPV